MKVNKKGPARELLKRLTNRKCGSIDFLLLLPSPYRYPVVCLPFVFTPSDWFFNNVLLSFLPVDVDCIQSLYTG